MPWEMIVIAMPATDTICFVTKWTGIDGTVVAARIHTHRWVSRAAS
jgi:hypothetical protein